MTIDVREDGDRFTVHTDFTLPDNVRADEIRTRHNNGVLEVVIPKQAAPETRRVNVEVN